MGTLEPPRRGGSNEYPQSMFLSRNKKQMYTPVNPSFTTYKWGLRGSKLYKYVFVIEGGYSAAVLPCSCVSCFIYGVVFSLFAPHLSFFWCLVEEGGEGGGAEEGGGFDSLLWHFLGTNVYLLMFSSKKERICSQAEQVFPIETLYILPIYAECTLLPLLFEPVHFP